MQKLSEAQIDKLIDLVQAKPELYDKKNEAFSNVSGKEKIWSEIASEVCTSDRNVRKAWKSIRDQFHRSMHYIMTKTEDGMQMTPTRKYKYFNRLLFLVGSADLRKYVVPKLTAQSLSNLPALQPKSETKDPLKVKSSTRRNSVDLEEDTFEFNGIEEFINFNKLPGDNCIKDEEPTCGSDFEMTVGSAGSTAEQVDVEEQPLQIYVRDSHSGFLDMVGEQLNKLPEVTQEEIKMKILTLLHKEVNEVIRSKRKRQRSK